MHRTVYTVYIVQYIYAGCLAREELSMVGMESRILEIGMLACADDPVIDFETFLSQCAKQLSSTRTT